ncbi:MAG: hypothetical protein A2064_05050 [Spirochaetes bacterium GWB1_66_5]|nr:MAG: hypothetical protein A2064_05050 [Spirochaetes bacterium GWB1_66_5]
MFMACATKRPALIPVAATVSAESEGLTASLTFRDDAGLNREFGNEANPYRTEYNKMQFRRRMVFELTLSNGASQDYRFQLADCELQYGGKTVRATSAFQLIEEWRLMDSSRKMAAQKEPIIKKTLVATQKMVPPGTTLRGLVLFQGNLPAHGLARITIPGIEERSYLQFDYEF